MKKRGYLILLLLFFSFILLPAFPLKGANSPMLDYTGRYKLVPHKGEILLLDTWSGRVWMMVYDKSKKENWFKELVVFDNENSIPYLRIMSDVKKRIIENKKLKKKKSEKKKKWIEEIMGGGEKKK